MSNLKKSNFEEQRGQGKYSYSPVIQTIKTSVLYKW